MSRFQKTVAATGVALLGLSISAFTMDSVPPLSPIPPVAIDLEDTAIGIPPLTVESPTVTEPSEDGSEVDEETSGTVDPNRWADVKNVCESFTVVEGATLVKNNKGEKVYPTTFRRNRYKRSTENQRRTRELIHLVAKEMGANVEGQYLVDMIAHHESSWNPEAIHVLNRDLEANQNTYASYTYSAAAEQKIEKTLASTDAKTKAYWNLKSQLADMRRYKNNPYWTAQLEYTHHIPERGSGSKLAPAQEWKEHRSVWAFGYGLFGMNAVLYTHMVGRDAPPWILCADEGIPAIVTAIWALREQQSTCAYLSQKEPDKYGTAGGTVRGILYRWGRGQCGVGKPGKAWVRLMESYEPDVAKLGGHLTWDTTPHFGDNFSQFERYKKGGKWHYKRDDAGKRIPSDRKAIFEHMRTKAAEKGLLRDAPLERKTPGSAPVIVTVTHQD